MELLLWAAIGLFVYAFYKWATLNNNYFLKKGVKYVEPYFLLGTSTTMVTRHLSMPEYVKMLYNQFPKEK
jgi:hypothetical protein